jgi:6,7-dimethyl-8-ribityllumazine synthase
MAGKSKTGSAVKPAKGLVSLVGDPAARPTKGRATNGRVRKVAIVTAKFNSLVTDQLEAGAVACLVEHGAKAEEIVVAKVPGAVELPLAAKTLAATGKYEAVVALGCVIRGDTSHYDYVCSMAADGIREAAMGTGVPVIFGVLTTENLEQALERAEAGRGNKGREAALGALEMADLLEKIRGGVKRKGARK